MLRQRMDHYIPDVPGLGNVAVSRHAQARMVEDRISEHAFKEALLNGTTTPDGQEVPEVYVHFSAIESGGFRTLHEGERVEFELVSSTRGNEASHVLKV